MHVFVCVYVFVLTLHNPVCKNLTGSHWHLSTGVVQADHEDEAQRPEEATDGKVSWRGRPGLRRSGQVKNTIEVYMSIGAF